MQSIHGYDNSFTQSENRVEICQNANTTVTYWDRAKMQRAESSSGHKGYNYCNVLITTFLSLHCDFPSKGGSKELINRKKNESDITEKEARNMHLIIWIRFPAGECLYLSRQSSKVILQENLIEKYSTQKGCLYAYLSGRQRLEISLLDKNEYCTSNNVAKRHSLSIKYHI